MFETFPRLAMTVAALAATAACAADQHPTYKASEARPTSITDELLPAGSNLRISPTRIATNGEDNGCFMLDTDLHLQSSDALEIPDQGISFEGKWIGLRPSQLPERIAKACGSKALAGGRVWFAEDLLKVAIPNTKTAGK